MLNIRRNLGSIAFDSDNMFKMSNIVPLRQTETTYLLMELLNFWQCSNFTSFFEQQYFRANNILRKPHVYNPVVWCGTHQDWTRCDCVIRIYKDCNETSNILLKTTHTLYIIVQRQHTLTFLFGGFPEKYCSVLINYFFSPYKCNWL